MDLDSKINRQLAGQPVAYFLFEFQVKEKDTEKDINYLKLFLGVRSTDGGSQARTIIFQCSFPVPVG